MLNAHRNTKIPLNIIVILRHACKRGCMALLGAHSSSKMEEVHCLVALRLVSIVTVMLHMLAGKVS